MKFLVVLLITAFSMEVSYKSFGQSPTPSFPEQEVNSACYSLEVFKRLLSCYTLQTQEACLREVEFLSDSGSGESDSSSGERAELSFTTTINEAIAEAHSLLQKFGSVFSCYESQGDTQHCPERGPIYKTLMEEKAFCSLNLECDDQETEAECQERQNKELDCNIKAVAAAQERFCSDWIPADQQNREDDPTYRAPTTG